MTNLEKLTVKREIRLPVALLVLFLLTCSACAPSASTENSIPPEGKENMMRVLIIANGKTFTAYFYDTSAARKFIGAMPLSITMSDLNRNEKYYSLNETLPASSTERPAVIRAGEIMCWLGNTLVLFYETFSNSYSGYVRLGYIENIDGLTDALGRGSVKVTFRVQ